MKKNSTTITTTRRATSALPAPRVAAASAAPAAGATAAGKKTDVVKKTTGGLRPPMMRASTASMARAQAKPTRTTPGATTTTASAEEKSMRVAEADAPAPASAASYPEKKVRGLLLAFFHRADPNRLYSREKALVADVEAIVKQLVAERDDARREVQNLRQAERERLSPVARVRWADEDNEEELEEKPKPTMWQLIAAGYADDPDLAEAWTGLQDDPVFEDLHEPEVCSLATQVRAKLRLDCE